MLESIPPAGWTAITGAVAALIGWLSTRRVSKADVMEKQTESSIRWIEAMDNGMRGLRGRLGEMEAELAQCHDANATQLAHMRLEIDDCERRHEAVVAELGRLETYLREQGFDYPGKHE